MIRLSAQGVSLRRFGGLWSEETGTQTSSLRLLFVNGFLLMFSYYLLRPVREAFILAGGNAEVRSYAVAVTALVLILLLPLYSTIFRHHGKAWLVRWIMGLSIGCLLIFALLASLDIPPGFFFFVWLGVFSVLTVAQFWATAADTCGMIRGQTAFPTIGVGVSLGALAGSQVAAALFQILGSAGLILLAAAMLATPLLWSRRLESGDGEDDGSLPDRSMMPGYGVLVRDRYLCLIALSVVLLNWINSTGDFILAKAVVTHAHGILADFLPASDRDAVIAVFYGRFYAGVSFLALFLQLFLAPKLMRHVGMQGSALLLPGIMIAGYGIMAFVPIFSVIQITNLLENSSNYSVHNTARQAMFLPVDEAARYEGKTIIDTLFWRLGDLIQAGAIYVGAELLGCGLRGFVVLNLCLAATFGAVTLAIGRRYARRVKRRLTVR